MTGGTHSGWTPRDRPPCSRLILALAGLVSVPALAGVARAQERRVDDEPAAEGEVVRLERERKVLVGPDVGYALLTHRGDAGVSYEAGLTWGGHARIELRPWMGLRFSARNSRHVVDLAPGALSTSDSAALDGVELDHPLLDVWKLEARFEPTWVATSRLRLWAGPGVGWARFETSELEARVSDCTVQCRLQTPKRQGSAVELSGALGATYDVIPRWVAASLAVSGGGFVGKPVGTLFDEQHPMQAFVDGSMLHLAALPEPASAFAGRLSVDVIF